MRYRRIVLDDGEEVMFLHIENWQPAGINHKQIGNRHGCVGNLIHDIGNKFKCLGCSALITVNYSNPKLLTFLKEKRAKAKSSRPKHYLRNVQRRARNA